MKNDTVHAITLGVIKYGATSLISTCYTLEHGLQSYMLKGILSKGGRKISKSLFEPLNLLELQASKNPNNRLGYIKEAKLNSARVPYFLTPAKILLMPSWLLFKFST